MLYVIVAGSVLERLMNPVAVKIGSSGRRRFLTSGLKLVSLCYQSFMLCLMFSEIVCVCLFDLVCFAIFCDGF